MTEQQQMDEVFAYVTALTSLQSFVLLCAKTNVGRIGDQSAIENYCVDIQCGKLCHDWLPESN